MGSVPLQVPEAVQVIMLNKIHTQTLDTQTHRICATPGS